MAGQPLTRIACALLFRATGAAAGEVVLPPSSGRQIPIVAAPTPSRAVRPPLDSSARWRESHRAKANQAYIDLLRNNELNISRYLVGALVADPRAKLPAVRAANGSSIGVLREALQSPEGPAVRRDLGASLARLHETIGAGPSAAVLKRWFDQEKPAATNPTPVEAEPPPAAPEPVRTPLQVMGTWELWALAPRGRPSRSWPALMSMAESRSWAALDKKIAIAARLALFNEDEQKIVISSVDHWAYTAERVGPYARFRGLRALTPAGVLALGYLERDAATKARGDERAAQSPEEQRRIALLEKMAIEILLLDNDLAVPGSASRPRDRLRLKVKKGTDFADGLPLGPDAVRSLREARLPDIGTAKARARAWASAGKRKAVAARLALFNEQERELVISAVNYWAHRAQWNGRSEVYQDKSALTPAGALALAYFRLDATSKAPAAQASAEQRRVAFLDKMAVEILFLENDLAEPGSSSRPRDLLRLEVKEGRDYANE